MGDAGTADAQRQQLFDGAMYAVGVHGWPADLVHPASPMKNRVEGPDGARLSVQAIHPHDRRPVPSADGATVLLDSGRFSLGNSGNRTLGAPKRSWKVELEDDDETLTGMSCFNLKSMFNDPSQMREALAWRIFRQAGVVAPRHTFARFAINGRYLGLFSLIEQVDKAFLSDRFGSRHRGNVFKVYCGDIGAGTLAHRVGADGDDSGRQYVAPGDDPTYRLKSYSHEPDAESYDDLAGFIRTINGIGLAGGDERFETDAFADAVREVFDVESFLRWASVNVLVGAWDNYFATPANYYLYNGGRAAGSQDLITQPYFTWIPWDYDNTFGIDYFGTDWQYTDLLDWPANTERYWGHRHRSHIPLVQNLLRHRQFRRYYLDHVEHLLDTVFNPATIDAAIGLGDDQGGGLWDRVATSGYLESATPYGSPFTGRQYTNDEIYRAGFEQLELRHGQTFVLGIHHYVRMRYDRARAQLAELRRDDPAGSGGVSFPAPDHAGGPDELRRPA